SLEPWKQSPTGPRYAHSTHISSMVNASIWKAVGSLPSMPTTSTSLSKRWNEPSRLGAPSLPTNSRVPPSLIPVEAPAFGLRRNHVLVEIFATVAEASDPTSEQRHRQWVHTTLNAFSVMALPGGYPHFLATDDESRIAKSYGPNGGRLAKAKRHYDP